MTMELYAFWRCLDFPYLEGERVAGINDDGRAVGVGAGDWRKPALIVPLEDGQRIAAELDALRQVYKIEMHRVKEKWLAQVADIVPAALLRLSPAEPKVLPKDRFPVGARIRVTAGPYRDCEGSICETEYSDPMVRLDGDDEMVEFHRPEFLEITGGPYLSREEQPGTESLTLVTMLKLGQAGIITKAPDANDRDDGAAFCLTPKGAELLGDLIEAVAHGKGGEGVKVARRRRVPNPAVDGSLPDVRFVPQKEEPKAEPEPDLSGPRMCDCPHCGRMFSITENEVPIPTTPPPPTPPAPPPTPDLSDIIEKLNNHEKDMLLLCRPPRSIKAISKKSGSPPWRLYESKNHLVRNNLIIDSGSRDPNNAVMWTLTDTGRVAVEELGKRHKGGNGDV
jgi:hypothetical protein